MAWQGGWPSLGSTVFCPVVPGRGKRCVEPRPGTLTGHVRFATSVWSALEDAEAALAAGSFDLCRAVAVERVLTDRDSAYSHTRRGNLDAPGSTLYRRHASGLQIRPSH
jgi:hypothetical protein